MTLMDLAVLRLELMMVVRLLDGIE